MNDKKLRTVKAIQNNEVMAVEYTGAINGGIEIADLYEEVAAFINPEIVNGVKKMLKVNFLFYPTSIFDSASFHFYNCFCFHRTSQYTIS